MFLSLELNYNINSEHPTDISTGCSSILTPLCTAPNILPGHCSDPVDPWSTRSHNISRTSSKRRRHECVEIIIFPRGTGRCVIKYDMCVCVFCVHMTSGRHCRLRDGWPCDRVFPPGRFYRLLVNRSGPPDRRLSGSANHTWRHGYIPRHRRTDYRISIRRGDDTTVNVVSGT